MLPAVELTAYRLAALDAMPDTCTVQTRTETSTKGSVVITYANTYTDVSCRVMPRKGQVKEYVTGEKIKAVAGFVLTVPWDQALTPGDRIVHDSKTYEVLGVFEKHSYRTACRADLARVF